MTSPSICMNLRDVDTEKDDPSKVSTYSFSASATTLVPNGYKAPPPPPTQPKRRGCDGFRILFGLSHIAQSIAMTVMIQRADSVWKTTLIPPEFVTAFRASGVVVPYQFELPLAGGRIKGLLMAWTILQFCSSLFVFELASKYKSTIRRSVNLTLCLSLFYGMMITMLCSFFVVDLFQKYGTQRCMVMLVPNLWKLASAIIWLPIVHTGYEVYMCIRFPHFKDDRIGGSTC